MTKLEKWAEKTQARRIVLQVVGDPGPERWRAEAIDESGSTAGLELGPKPDSALGRLMFALAQREKA